MSKRNVLQRLLGGVKSFGRALTDNSGQGADWFGPQQPMPAQAPAEVAGRQFDYPVGYNLWQQPKVFEGRDFRSLRGLADGYDVLRLLIETRKDQMCGLPWVIKRRDPTAVGDDPRIAALESFFRCPDGINSWSRWLRMLLEDLLVIDAPTLYIQRTLGGQALAFQVMDGATIKPVIDDFGRRPAPPAPAYQQVLKGLPAVDYTADDLLYLPRNPRSHRVYGYSPVEQLEMTVNIALRRQLYQLQYYTEGNIPEALIGVPDTWNPDQIKQFQAYWDILHEGDTASRRHAKFVPGGVAKTFIPIKEPELKGVFDEWLARVACYCFSVSPQPFVAQMNRATAETAAQSAESEGNQPAKLWVKELIDGILTREFAASDLEFIWQIPASLDPSVQATTINTYVRAGVMTLNESRNLLGLAPVADGDQPLIYTGTGVVTLHNALASGNTVQPSFSPTLSAQVSPVAKYNENRSERTGRYISALVAEDDDVGGGAGGDPSTSTSSSRALQDKADHWQELQYPEKTYPKEQIENWNKFKKSLNDRQDLSNTERYAFLKTFGWEGGLKEDKKGKSFAGLVSDDINHSQFYGYKLNDLTVDQVINVYKYLEHDYTRSKGIGIIGDSSVAAQFFDVRFQHSIETSTEIFREAIRSVITQPGFPEDTKVDIIKNLKNGGSDYMRKYIKEVVSSEYSEKLINEISNERNKEIIKLDGKNDGSSLERTYGY